jgi:hypothetical protein
MLSQSHLPRPITDAIRGKGRTGHSNRTLPPNPIPSPALRPLAHGRRPSRQIPSRPPKGNRARPSKSRGGNREKMRGIRRSSPREARDPIGEVGEGSEPQPTGRRRNLWWVAPRLGNRALLRGGGRGAIARRGGASGGRSAGGRGEGDRGAELGTGRVGSVFISSRSFF